MSANSIFRHPELALISYKQLRREFTYTYKAFWIAVNLVTEEAERTYRNLPTHNSAPIKKLIEDVTIHADRLQAIREEIEYRRIP